MTIAFLAPIPAVVTEKKPALPVFKPRWWHDPERLDARPVAWSLRNRPDEWKLIRRNIREGEVESIVHIPSKHKFYIEGGCGHYHLFIAECSCSDLGNFQAFQQGMFHRALKHWRRRQAVASGVQEQFAAHFVR